MHRFQSLKDQNFKVSKFQSFKIAFKGSIIKDEVEAQMLEERGLGRYSVETLNKNLEIVLKDLENRTELFEDLLCSYPSRLEAVRAAQGQHTPY